MYIFNSIKIEHTTAHPNTFEVHITYHCTLKQFAYENLTAIKAEASLSICLNFGNYITEKTTYLI